MSLASSLIDTLKSISQAFSFTDTPRKRNFLILILTLMYNASNIGLYIESPNEFPEHYGLIDHRLSEFNKDNAGQITAFAFICLFNAILAYSNQTSYTYHIDKTLPKMYALHEDFETEPLMSKKEPEPSPFDLVMSGISSAFKAAVASSSLAALLKNTPAGAGWAIGASVLTALGNFAAQFAIFAAPLIKKKYNVHLDLKIRWALAHFFTTCYNTSNAVLYFNAGDEFLRHINVLDHRLIDGPNGWEYVLFSLLIVSSFFLLFSTQRSYSKKIEDIFTDPKKEPPTDIAHIENNGWDCFWDKLTPFLAFESRYTAAYKAAINYISLVATLFSFTHSLSISFVLSSLCIPGNLYAQFSILKPERSKKQMLDDYLEPKVSRPYFFDLLNRTEVRKPCGLSLQNPRDFVI